MKRSTFLKSLGVAIGAIILFKGTNFISNPRKELTINDIKKAKKAMDEMGTPADGRHIYMDKKMYKKIMNDLNSGNKKDTNLFGFQIYKY